ASSAPGPYFWSVSTRSFLSQFHTFTQKFHTTDFWSTEGRSHHCTLPPVLLPLCGRIEQEGYCNLFARLAPLQGDDHDLLPQHHQAQGCEATCDRVIGLTHVAHTRLVPDVHLQSCHNTLPSGRVRRAVVPNLPWSRCRRVLGFEIRTPFHRVF